MASPALALPSDDRDRPRGLLTIGALIAGVAQTMLFAGLAAAYLAVRTDTRPWPPKGVTFDNYLPNTLTITMVMTIVVAEWANWALRKGERRQVVGAIAVLTALGFAFLNLLWYLGSRLGYGPATSAYGSLVWPMLVLIGVAAAVGVVLTVSVLPRMFGAQVSPRRPDAMRAVRWYWQFVVLGWLVVYFTVFIKK